jgi:hypothetical protein
LERIGERTGERQAEPVLKELVREASRSLACLDAERLEELALSCQALNRDLHRDRECDGGGGGKRHEVPESEAREALRDLAVFARVLEATRANILVMERLRELRAGRLEYGIGIDRARPVKAGEDGDD